jgi:hypothetical protein
VVTSTCISSSLAVPRRERKRVGFDAKAHRSELFLMYILLLTTPCWWMRPNLSLFLQSWRP